MKILFLLILHHFGDIQPVVIPAKSKAEACVAMKSWTNSRSIGASTYAAEVFAVEGVANDHSPMRSSIKFLVRMGSLIVNRQNTPLLSGPVVLMGNLNEIIE